jgi:hypothetical protein
MPVPGLSEIVTTTLRNRTGKLADNVTKNNALLMRLQKRGNVKTVSGGRTIVQELDFAENSTYKRYSGYEVLNISPSETFTAAEFNYAQSAVAVSISGLEQLQNSGENAIIDLLRSRLKNAERTLINNIAVDCYSDGTADGGKQIGGLQLLVSKTPTSGTVGGIDRSTTLGTFWRNKASAPSGAPTSANIQSRMNALANQLVRGTDGADLIIADTNYYGTFLESLQAIQRITSTEMGAAGFASVKYFAGSKDADVVLDGGVGGGCPTNTMYFLNTNYIHFRPHADRNFVPIGDERYAVNQDAMVKLIAFAGNMTLSNGSLQGVLSNT